MKIIILSVLILVDVLAVSGVWAAPSEYGSLTGSIRRALEVAPEIKSADAEIARQQALYQQSGAWPNPSVSIQADNSLGLEDGRGGYDVTQLEISQPLPFNRLGRQREQALSALGGAEAQRRVQHLMLEYRVAQAFHAYQLALAKQELARQRLKEAEQYRAARGGRAGGDPLVRYLSPLEKIRLDVVLESARQAVEIGEGKMAEAAAQLHVLLALQEGGTLEVTPLNAPPAVKDYERLGQVAPDHPMLALGQHNLSFMQAGIGVARSKRLADPTLALQRSEQYIGGRRQETTGVMLSVELPLWDQGSGDITAARYDMHKAHAELTLNQREISASHRKSYLHLGHLIEQARHYETNLLSPAQRMFTLTQNAFMAGEVNVINLVDANSTYFDARERYLELLAEGWLELAELRKSAGMYVVESTPVNGFGEVN